MVYAFSPPREATETRIPDVIIQEPNRRRVALVGFADEEADKVCSAFEKARALPRLFGVDKPMDPEAIADCSVVMVHARPETLGAAWLSAASELPPRLPLVLVGARDYPLSFVPRVQSRACEFLIDAWQPEECCDAAEFRH